MAATTRAYLCHLPSGSTVRARKAAPILLLAQEAYILPILTAAMRHAKQEEVKAAAETGEPPEPEAKGEQQPLAVIVERVCRACLLEPRCPEDIAFADIPEGDAFALYQWAIGMPCMVIEEPEIETPWRLEDLMPLVGSNAALLVDMVARRYRTRPSLVLGLDEAPWQFDLDAAIAYRAVSAEKVANDRARVRAGGEGGPQMQGDFGDAVTAEDMFGNRYELPSAALASTAIAPHARVTDCETMSPGKFVN